MVKVEPTREAAMHATRLDPESPWVPHSYASCSQHAPNEHLLAPVVREEMQIMAGIYWDLGEKAA